MTEQTNPQQPDCPAEYEWIKPGVTAWHVSGQEEAYAGIVNHQPFYNPECAGHEDEFGDVWDGWMYTRDGELAEYCCSAARKTKPDAPPDELTTLRAENAALKARVGELENDLALYDAFTASTIKNEAWADTEAVKKARALLEGLGPVVDSLSGLRDAAASVSDGDWKIDDSIKGITTESGLCDIAFNLARWDQEFMVSAFNNLPNLIKALRELGQTLGVKNE